MTRGKTPVLTSDQARQLLDAIDVSMIVGLRDAALTGITAFLLGGGTLERAQQIAAHSSAKTTKLYDRRSDEITLDEIERIVI